MFSVAQGKALMRSPAKRLHWNSKRGVSESWNGWCAAWTYWFTGAHQPFLTAYDAALHTKIVSKDAAKAPAGAVHYWRDRYGTPRPGHVAVSLGNGLAGMASSRVTVRWGVDQGTIPVAAYNAQTSGFLTYLGWSYDFGGQRMVGVQTLEQVKAAVKSTAKTHTVKSGDTLNAISKANGVSVAKIVALNKITNPNLIRVGQKIRLK